MHSKAEAIILCLAVLLIYMAGSLITLSDFSHIVGGQKNTGGFSPVMAKVSSPVTYSQLFQVSTDQTLC